GTHIDMLPQRKSAADLNICTCVGNRGGGLQQYSAPCPSNSREPSHIRAPQPSVQFCGCRALVVIFVRITGGANLMRVTKFIVLFVICTLAISIAMPAFAADGAATYNSEMRRLPWSRGTSQGRPGRERQQPDCRSNHRSADEG